jgi:thiamine-monophosphate kinase
LNIEKELIKLIRDTLGTYSSSLIGDDAALVGLEQGFYAFSLDNLVENTHFDSDIFSPYDIGWKSAAANISDMAAAAAVPLVALVGLSLRTNINDQSQWVKGFYEGFQACCTHSTEELRNFCEKYQDLKISLDAERLYPSVIGGDLTKAEFEISVSVAIIGKTLGSHRFPRAGAKAGYKVCVSGKFGNSKEFLEAYLKFKNSPDHKSLIRNFKQTQTPSNTEYFLQAKPRVYYALNLAHQCRDGALMDSSDGLAESLIEIASQSKVKIKINSDLVPRDTSTSVEHAIYGGEDFELVACLPEIPEGFREIGEVLSLEAGEKPSVYDIKTAKFLSESQGYKHFFN